MGWEAADRLRRPGSGEVVVTIKTATSARTSRRCSSEGGRRRKPTTGVLQAAAEARIRPCEFHPGSLQAEEEDERAAGAGRRCSDPANKVAERAWSSRKGPPWPVVVKRSSELSQRHRHHRRPGRGRRRRLHLVRSARRGDAGSRGSSSRRRTPSTRASTRTTCCRPWSTKMFQALDAAGVAAGDRASRAQPRLDHAQKEAARKPTSPRSRACSRTGIAQGHEPAVRCDSAYGTGDTHDRDDHRRRARRRQPVQHLRATRACRSARSPTPAMSPSTRRCIRPTGHGCTSCWSTSRPARPCSQPRSRSTTSP